MEPIRFTNPEKTIFLAISKDEDLDAIHNISKESKTSAVKYLTEKKLIKSIISYDEIMEIKITSFGIAYLENNPNLENPPDGNKLKSLQINELEYKKRIRKQEAIIRTWKVTSAVLALLGIIGWILLFFTKKL